MVSGVASGLENCLASSLRGFDSLCLHREELSRLTVLLPRRQGTHETQVREPPTLLKSTNQVPTWDTGCHGLGESPTTKVGSFRVT